MFNLFKKAKSNKDFIFKSPIKGELIKMEDVEDPVFSTKVLGEGIAIKPLDGKVYSPFKAKIETIFPTKHAIGIKFENGIEILIHIGINTVELNGEFFTSYIENGSEVNVGDLLLDFDIDGIISKGYSITTPIIVTNMEGFSKFEEISKTSPNIEVGEDLFKLKK